jgi:hypothetical protein
MPGSVWVTRAGSAPAPSMQSRPTAPRRVAVGDDDFEEIPPLNPAQCEAWIRRVSERIARGVRIVTDAEKAMLATKRDFDYAFANAFKNAQGSDNLRRQTAVVEAMPWREKADNAVIAFRYAQRTAEGLERELFAAMSINKSVVSMYSAAGVGEP